MPLEPVAAAIGPPPKRSFARALAHWATGLIAGLVGGAAVAAMVEGWVYYQLPAPERPFHPRHDLLRPSGGLGLSAGLLGTLSLLISFAYVLRKNVVRGFMSLRQLQTWMRVHVLSGFLGALLIVVHSSFLPSSVFGLIGLTSLLVTVFSGIAGRYLMRLLPPDLDESKARPGLRRLLSTWRFFHRWLSIILLLAMVFHVVVALRYADLWILGGGE